MTKSSYLPNIAAKRPANTSLSWIFNFAAFSSSSSSSNTCPSVFPPSDIFPPPHLLARACSLSSTANSSPPRFPFLLSSIRSSSTRLLSRGEEEEVVVGLAITPPCGGSPNCNNTSLSSWMSSVWSGNWGRSSGASTQWLSMSTKHRLACVRIWDKPDSYNTTNNFQCAHQSDNHNRFILSQCTDSYLIQTEWAELYPLIKLWDGDLHTINRFLAFHFDKCKNANRILACERLSVIVATGDNVESAVSVGDSDVKPLQKNKKQLCP